MHFKYIALPLLAAMLTLTGCTLNSNVSKKILNVHVSTKDEDIRTRLLAYTPLGSDATNVLQFVVDDLRPKDGCMAYVAYVHALQSGRHDKLPVTPIDPAVMSAPPDWTARYIYVVIGEYLGGEYYWRLDAKWTFDKNDKLVNIDISRSEEH